MNVELVYEKTCPNIAAAREQLLRAFGETGLTPRWREWEISDPAAPAHVHGYGSPTILVDGKDVSGADVSGDDLCCRLYAHGETGRQQGVPAQADIGIALRKRASTSSSPGGGMKLNSSLLPTIGVALLPKLTCPACWPAYAGLLGALGLGFVDYTPYLLPLSVLFVVAVLATLAYRARQRHGYRPLLLGALAGTLLLIGKFQYDNDTIMYLGLGLLIGASVWNTWPRQSVEESCPACAPRQAGH